MIRHLLVISALLLAQPATAAATEPPNYPHQRAAASPTLETMINAGITFWAQRGVTITQPVELLIADDVGTAQDGLGDTPFSGDVRARSIAARDYGVNRVVLREDWAHSQLREMRDRHVGREYAAHVCALLWHELGHVGGVANPALVNGVWVDRHPAEGLMSQQLTIPDDCQVLAKKLTPRSMLARSTRRLRHHPTGNRRAKTGTLRH